MENGQVKDVLVGLEDLDHAHADGVFSAIDKSTKKFAGDTSVTLNL